MADKRTPENKSAPTAPTPEPGATTADAPAIRAADKKRQQELAQAGYILPDEQFIAAQQTVEREKDIAANMPSTDGSKPHEP
jgi:hypothetical protein